MLEFKRLRDGRIVNKEYQYIVIHTIGCESLFIANSLDNVFSFVLEYIQRVKGRVAFLGSMLAIWVMLIITYFVEKLLNKGSG